jgi:hypothetical protein
MSCMEHWRSAVAAAPVAAAQSQQPSHSSPVTAAQSQQRSRSSAVAAAQSQQPSRSSPVLVAQRRRGGAQPGSRGSSAVPLVQQKASRNDAVPVARGVTHLYPTLLNPSPRLPLFLIHIYHHSPDGEPIRADSTVRSSPLPSFQLHHVHGVGGVELSFNGDVRERRAQRRPTRHALDSQHCNTANTAPAPPSRRRWTPALAASQAQAPRTSRETLT